MNNVRSKDICPCVPAPESDSERISRILRFLKKQDSPVMAYQFRTLSIAEKVLRSDLSKMADDGLISVHSDYGKIRYQLNT